MWERLSLFYCSERLSLGGNSGHFAQVNKQSTLMVLVAEQSGEEILSDYLNFLITKVEF